jgi:hypothetical protein
MELSKFQLNAIKLSLSADYTSKAIDKMLSNATFSSIPSGVRVTYDNDIFDDFFYTVTLVHSSEIEE